MTSRCSIELLESALAGSLPAADETSLHLHLDECEACSAALERMAGWAAWCEEGASLLTEDELDELRPTREDWEVDFTVEHLDATDEPNALGRLGDFDVLEIIGQGGMGVVLKAHDHKLNRRVAIKVLSPHLAQNSLARKRFAREAQAAAAVVHPNVLAIHQVQPNGPLPFLVMSFVAGESLAERLTARGTLELAESLRIGMQAAAGLAAAHEQGLVHRDVKPANILLEKGIERAVLTDFGLARAADDVTLTRWGIIAGTPQYMSPEQARGEPLDRRSDLFSLGCVLYEMATGVSPFRSDSLMATMRRLVDEAPRAMESLNPELPPWFVAIVERLLKKDPSQRFSSAKEVSELLEECLAHVQQPATAPLPAGVSVLNTAARTAVSARRWRVIGYIGGILAILILGLGGYGAFLMTTSREPAIVPTTGRTPDVESSVYRIDKATGDQRSHGTREHRGRSAKLQRERRFDPGMRVGAMDCSLDGKLIALSNQHPKMIKMSLGRTRVADNWQPSVKILDAETGKPLISLKVTISEEDAVLASTEQYSNFRVDALAFSPDGNVVAVGTSIGQVKLFNARTGELVRSLDDEKAKLAHKKTPENWKLLARAMGSISSLAFSPDGSMLASSGRSFDDFSSVFDDVAPSPELRTGPGRLKLWHVQTGTLKHDLVGHSHAHAVAFSPNGSSLASAGRWRSDSESGTGVIIWNAENGAKARTISTEAVGGARSVTFSSDGKLVAIGWRSIDKENNTNTNALGVFDAVSGIMEWQRTFAGLAKPVAFMSHDQYLVVLCRGELYWLDPKTGSIFAAISPADYARGVRWDDFAVAPQGYRLAVSGVTKDKQQFVEPVDFGALRADSNP